MKQEKEIVLDNFCIFSWFPAKKKKKNSTELLRFWDIAREANISSYMAVTQYSLKIWIDNETHLYSNFTNSKKQILHK